jgi:hypothetical protein
MTRQQIIDLAFSGYPGGRGTGGDTLALFIARELSDTFEPGRSETLQLAIAAHALQRGVEDLQAALKPLCKRLAMETARNTSAAAKPLLKAA